MTYRAKPVTQHDGSALANSNCRMASIATGLDYDTLGADTSTASKMRSYTDDQSGGTDSGDAKEAWSRGYGQALTVRDGRAWADALADLKAGRLVHLDVWHASAGGPCLSGSGAYGHTMAVAPEANGSRWLVADPWCNPGKWVWWEAAKLQAGSEEWGRRVYGTAVQEADWPTGGHLIGDPRDLVALAIVARIVRFLMTRYRPDAPAPEGTDVPTPGDWGDTGGGKPILFTTTAAHGADAGGDTMRFANANDLPVHTGKVLNVGAGASWVFCDGSPGGTFSKAATLVWGGRVDSEPDQHLVLVTTGVPYTDKVARDSWVMVRSTNDPYDAPAPPPPDTDTDVAQAVADRDEDWREWLLAGSPGEDPEAP